MDSWVNDVKAITALKLDGQAGPHAKLIDGTGEETFAGKNFVKHGVELGLWQLLRGKRPPRQGNC